MRIPPGLLPVPDTRQSTTYSCGASAMQAVLMYWGDEYLESDLMERLHTDPQEGTHPVAMVEGARELGYQAEMRENLTVQDLERSVAQGVPVIIACQAWPDEPPPPGKDWSEVWDTGHYMVVIGTDADHVYFEDPSLLGSRGVLPRQEFEARWHDQDGDRRFVRLGIYVRGERPSPPPELAPVG